MKRNTSAKAPSSEHAPPPPSGGGRGQILIVEPDPLTQWSMKTYLGKWFRVAIADSTVGAQNVLGTCPIDALIVSEELPAAELVALERLAHSFNASVSIVRIVTDSGTPCRPGPHSGYLEKPFTLARLASLLGIPEEELPGEL